MPQYVPSTYVWAHIPCLLTILIVNLEPHNFFLDSWVQSRLGRGPLSPPLSRALKSQSMSSHKHNEVREVMRNFSFSRVFFASLQLAFIAFPALPRWDSFGDVLQLVFPQRDRAAPPRPPASSLLAIGSSGGERAPWGIGPDNCYMAYRWCNPGFQKSKG